VLLYHCIGLHNESGPEEGGRKKGHFILYPINEKCAPPGIIATPVDNQRAAVGWTGGAIDFLTGARGQVIAPLGQVIAPLAGVYGSISFDVDVCYASQMFRTHRIKRGC